MRTALYNFSNGLPTGIAKAVKQLENAGPRPVITAQRVVDALLPLFPPPVDGDVPDALFEHAWSLVQSPEFDVVYSVEAVSRAANSKRSDSAPGMSGASARVLKQCLHRCNDDQTAHLCKLLSILGNGHVPRQWTQFLHLLYLLKGVPIPKPKTSGLRPIGVAEIVLNIANTVMCRSLRPTFVDECGGNLAIGVRGGGEIMANTVRAATDADPTLCVVNLDVKNFFGSASRKILIQALCDRVQAGCDAFIPFLRNTLQMCQSGMSIVFHHSHGGGASVIPFLTGFYQGGPVCGPQTAIVKKVIKEGCRRRLVEEIGAEPAKLVTDIDFADDTDILVPVPFAEKTILIFTSETAKFTAGCNVSKSAIYRAKRDDIDHIALCGVADRLDIKSNGIAYQDLPPESHGLITAGAAIGTIAFQQAALQPRLDKAIALVDRIVSVVQEAQVSEKRRPVERSLHAAWTIIRLCIHSRLTYFSRVHDSHVFSPFGAKLDTYTYAAITSLMNIRATDIALVREEGPEAEKMRKTVTRQLFALPTRMGGLGFTTLASHAADAARLASIAETANAIRSIAWRHVCTPVPPDAPNPNPLEQPLLPSVTAAALRSIGRLKDLHKLATDRLSTMDIPPETSDSDSASVPFEGFLKCMDVASGALDNTLAADAASSISELQEGLTAGVHEARKIFILGNGIPSVWHLLAFREQSCSIASAWLNTIPDPRLGNFIPNLPFIFAVGVRLFMHPNPRASTPDAPRVTVNCAACATHPTAPRQVPFDEVHLVTCRSAGHKSEHDAVTKSISTFASSYLRESGAGHTILEQWYTSVPGCTPIPDPLRRARRDSLYPNRVGTATLPDKAAKGDVTIIARPEPQSLAYDTTLIDVTCTSPPHILTQKPPRGPAAKALCAKSPPSRFPAEAEAMKVAEFVTSFNIDPDAHITFRPFGMSRTGRLGPSASLNVRYINTILDRHGATGRSAAKSKSTLLDLISTALHGGIGTKAIRTVERHRACLPIMLQQQQLQPHHQQQNLVAGQIPMAGAPAAPAAGAGGPASGAVSATGDGVTVA
jgi:hypothetical protein